MSHTLPDSALLPVYNRADIIMQRGEGMYLYTETGRKYLDFASGIAVNALGHCHPHLVKALQDQAGLLWHCSNLYRTRGLEEGAGRLVENSFADRVFMTNSGTEAVETGIKMIRRFHYSKGSPRPRIITVEGAFHGRSIACISAGKSAKGIEGYAPLADGFDQVPFGDMTAMRAAITPQTGGIMLETIQGEGGIRAQPRDYLRAIRALTQEQGILLFLDEVQCGSGRTGALFAFEDYAISPDICAIAKGIGGGFPVGSCLATEHAARGMTKGTHGGTYGGNPLAMAAVNAVLDIILDKNFLKKVKTTGDYLKQELTSIAADFPDIITEVRGTGLMLGLQMKPDAQAIVALWREHGLLTASASQGNVIRILPPLIAEENHVREAVGIIRHVANLKNG